jgi:ribosomal RNA assembly protein
MTDMEFTYDLKVPKERIAVLIGGKGKIKKAIESSTDTKMEIDSKEGDIFLSGLDALGLYTAKEVIRSIGRGFNPDFALQLLKTDYALEMFNMNEYSGKNKSTLLRLKGRVIGKDGKARRLIEELTETHICVYGKTIGIIGMIEDVAIARKAVESLLSGSPHSNVYRWLENKRKEKKRQEFLGKEI